MEGTFKAITLWLGTGTEAAAALMIGLATLAATAGTRAGIARARLTVAEGVIAALGHMTAAALSKTIALRSWNAILLFGAVLAPRTFVKRVLLWEEARLRARRAGPATPSAAAGTAAGRSAPPGT